MEARNFSSRDSNNLGSNNVFSPSRFTVPSIEQMIKKQIQDLRERIYDYKVLGFDLNNLKKNKQQNRGDSKIPDHADIIIFGPTGSGKSSLIRTFYRALYDTKALPEHIQDSLCIKGKNENEGTTKFTAVLIKKRGKIRNKNLGQLRQTQQLNSARETTTLETFHLPKNKIPGQITNRDISANPLNNMSDRLSQATPQSQYEQSTLNQDLDGEQVNQIINELLENKSSKRSSQNPTPAKQNQIENQSINKKSSKNKTQKAQEYSSAIIVHDTRGQIWMDEKEKEQLTLLIKGKVKDKNMVQQRNHRYAYMLWEFWKRDIELFPSNMIQKSKSLKRKPHCIIFVFDGSFDDIPNGIEETEFYREILQQCRNRKYMYPQIVLTCADKIEDQLMNEELPQNNDEEIKFGESDQYEFQQLRTPKKMNMLEQEQRLRDILDLKIEKVALNLGVPRSSVHFIENYKNDQEEQSCRIDYKALRLLHECLLQSDSYILNNFKEKSKCSIF